MPTNPSGHTLENLKEFVGLYNDDRTGFTEDIEDLIEDPSSPGVYCLPRNADKLCFDDMRADAPKDRYNHYFKTGNPLLLTQNVYDNYTDLSKLDYELNP